MSFKIDPYEDMDVDQLKARCKALVREVYKWEVIALHACEGTVDTLPDDLKMRLNGLRAAYLEPDEDDLRKRIASLEKKFDDLSASVTRTARQYNRNNGTFF